MAHADAQEMEKLASKPNWLQSRRPACGRSARGALKFRLSAIRAVRSGAASLSGSADCPNPRHVMRVSCRRCHRIVEIQTFDALCI
jgi:hypothetical protein